MFDQLLITRHQYEEPDHSVTFLLTALSVLIKSAHSPEAHSPFFAFLSSYYHPLPIAAMSQNLHETLSTSNYQVIFDNALKAYKNKTGNDLPSDPLIYKLESCNSPDAVLDLLREEIPGFNQSGSSHDGPMKWLDPTVNVLFSFSSTIGGALSLVSLRKIEVVHAGLTL